MRTLKLSSPPQGQGLTAGLAGHTCRVDSRQLGRWSILGGTMMVRAGLGQAAATVRNNVSAVHMCMKGLPTKAHGLFIEAGYHTDEG